MARPVTRPDRELAARKRDRFVDTGEASRMLDGMLTAGQIRLMALRGEIKGAMKGVGVRKHILIPRHVVPSLVTELEYHAAPKVIRPRAGHTTFDGPMAV